MRRISLISFLVITLFSCRKGEDDPFISFRSRQARLCNEWTVATSTLDETGKITFFDGQFVYYQYQAGSSDKHPMSEKYTIRRDGSFTHIRAVDGIPMTSDGVWMFSGGIGRGRKRSKIVLIINESKAGGTPTKTYGKEEYEIVELRNKKMVWKKDRQGISKTYTSNTTEEIEFK